MYQVILLIHMFAAISLIVLVLVQQGRGSAVGAAFGSGASQTVFGSRGSGSFLLKITIGFGLIFFATSVGLNYMASRAVKQSQQVITLPSSSLKESSALPPVAPSSGSKNSKTHPKSN